MSEPIRFPAPRRRRALVAVLAAAVAAPGLVAVAARAGAPDARSSTRPAAGDRGGLLAVVAASPRPAGEARVDLITPDGRLVRRIGCPRGRCTDWWPAWSPDGARLAYGSQVVGELSRLVVARAAGTGRRRLAPADATHPSWSPDGRRIAYQAPLPDGEGIGIWTIRPNGRGARLVGDGQTPAWSASGWIAHTRPGREESDVWVIRPDGSDRRRLTRRGYDPAWSPDGARIAFTRSVRTAGHGVREDVFIASADGRDVHRLTRRGSQPAWSPDGARIAFVRGRAVYVVNADGSGLRRLPYEPRRIRGGGRRQVIMPAWQPDGTTATAASAGLTAVRARIADHAGFVRVVVDFAGGRLPDSTEQLVATDPQPFRDGTVRLRLARPGVRSAAQPAAAEGVTARVVQRSGAIAVRIAAARHRFKYMSHFTLHDPERHVIDLWESAPPSPAAELPRAPDGCLTLTRITTRPGRVSAAGAAGYLYEGSITIRLRTADGWILAERPTIAADGRWSARLRHPDVRRQAGTLEAVAESALDGALVCLVQARVTLTPAAPGSRQRR